MITVGYVRVDLALRGRRVKVHLFTDSGTISFLELKSVFDKLKELFPFLCDSVVNVSSGSGEFGSCPGFSFVIPEHEGIPEGCWTKIYT